MVSLKPPNAKSREPRRALRERFQKAHARLKERARAKDESGDAEKNGSFCGPAH